MKQLTILAVWLVSVYFPRIVLGQETQTEPLFSCIGEAESKAGIPTREDPARRPKTVGEIRAEIVGLQGKAGEQEAKEERYRTLCVIAELMKRIGDYEAKDFYEQATINSSEPGYELLYADYLRNFRGAQRPLFPGAEEHYFEAMRKFEAKYPEVKCPRIKETQLTDEACMVKNRIERGRITVYQDDGIPLLPWNPNRAAPNVFVGSINKYAQSTTDFDGVDDARDFASEALFAASPQRLNRPLTQDELRGIIRPKDQYETLNRLRFRYLSLPAMDIFYKRREIDDSQISNFFEPNRFNDFELDEYGIAVEKPLGFDGFDVFLRGIYKRIRREGLIEFLPEEEEDVNHYEVKAAISRFVGPDKANAEFTYVYQDIDPDIPNPADRDREIFAGVLTYQIFRPTVLGRLFGDVYEQRFETRGIDLFAGVVHDVESFGSVDVEKNDYFVGTAFRGLAPFKDREDRGPAFDITLQPTIFTSEVDGDESQDNSQYRTNLTMLCRLIDEELYPGYPPNVGMLYFPFVHLVVPVRHDVAIDGTDDFENFRVGVNVASKIFVTGWRDVTFLVSAGYDYQRFYHLDEDLSLFGVNLSMGF